MNTDDAATQLSLDYLRAIESRLSIFWNEKAEPICIHERVSSQSLYRLRYELHDLLSNSTRDAALQATIEFSKNRIQTVGFGLAPDFDEFVKLGFLCGQRLVLWDLIGSRLLIHREFTPDQVSSISAAACNLLLLRPIVEKGGLVILPHPTTWSEFARLVAEDLKEHGNRSQAAFGLSMALSTVEDGLILHPYTLLKDGGNALPNAAAADQSENLYSKSNYIFHQAISELLRDERFAFLRKVSVNDFYQVVTQYPDFNQEIAKHFSPTREGLSAQQSSVEIKQSIDKLSRLLYKRNRDMTKYFFEGSEATLGFAIASLTALATGKLDKKEAALGFIISDLSTKLFIALRKWYSKPQKPVVIQAFELLKDAA